MRIRRLDSPVVRIAITGGIASGKSTVTRCLRDHGFSVIDADELAREVVSAGTFGQAGVALAFGPEFVTAEGIDRKKIADAVFADVGKRRTLERIVHPLIQWRAFWEFRAANQRHDEVVFYDAALIYERGLEDQFDGVVVVNCSAEKQLERLCQRDQIATADAQKRINAQMALSEKVRRAWAVINNDGSLKETENQCAELIRRLKTDGPAGEQKARD